MFSLNNPAAAAAYVGRAIHSVEEIVVSAIQSGSEAPDAGSTATARLAVIWP